MTQSKEELLAEFDAHVEAIERSSIDTVWSLADWLVENVPNGKPGPRNNLDAQAAELPTISELADRSGYSQPWLKEMRQTAAAFSPGVRLPGGSLKAHSQALRKAKGEVEVALASLQKDPRLAAQDTDQHWRQSVRDLQNPDVRSKILHEVLSDPEVAVDVAKATFEQAPEILSDSEVSEVVTNRLATAPNATVLVGKTNTKWQEHRDEVDEEKGIDRDKKKKKPIPIDFVVLGEFSQYVRDVREARLKTQKQVSELVRWIVEMRRTERLTPDQVTVIRMSLRRTEEATTDVIESLRRWIAEISIALGDPIPSTMEEVNR